MFDEVAEAAGVAYDGWTTSAVWFDYDNDGDLDLFVCSFVAYGPEMGGLCGVNKLGKNFYCIPKLFDPTPSLLFRNQGDGTFVRADLGTEIETTLGKGLGVVATDVNGDRRLDLFVANDTVANFLFMNRANDQWEDIGLFAEVAYSADGRPRSGMGVDSADVNGDGKLELFVSNVDGEMFSLYQNKGDETFVDVARQNGVADATRFLSGWGLRFFDYDNDGDADLLLANGHPDDMIEQQRPNVTFAEPLLLFRNDDGLLRDVSAAAGPAFANRYPARGLATGDIDNDGRLDVAVGNNGEAPLLLLNRASAEAHWLGARLVGVTANRDAVGARIRWSSGGRVRQRFKVGGGSYLSSHDPREILGLGSATALDWVEIAWPAPSDRVERFTGLEIDRYVTLTEGRGSPVDLEPGRSDFQDHHLGTAQQSQARGVHALHSHAPAHRQRPAAGQRRHARRPCARHGRTGIERAYPRQSHLSAMSVAGRQQVGPHVAQRKIRRVAEHDVELVARLHP